MKNITSVFATQQIPEGYCQCGCGQKTSVVNGIPNRFVHGHNGRCTTTNRFWSKVDRCGPDECWEWIGWRHKGYGRFAIHGKTHRAHRVAYELVNGPIQDRQEVCHSCDNPACCNPSHLFLGTHKDNMLDAINKNRFVEGEADGNAKLTTEQVVQMRTLYWGGGYTLPDMARRFRVSPAIVWRVIHGISWKHAPGLTAAPNGWRRTRH